MGVGVKGFRKIASKNAAGSDFHKLATWSVSQRACTAIVLAFLSQKGQPSLRKRKQNATS